MFPFILKTPTGVYCPARRSSCLPIAGQGNKRGNENGKGTIFSLPLQDKGIKSVIISQRESLFLSHCRRRQFTPPLQGKGIIEVKLERTQFTHLLQDKGKGKVLFWKEGRFTRPLQGKGIIELKSREHSLPTYCRTREKERCCFGKRDDLLAHCKTK